MLTSMLANALTAKEGQPKDEELADILFGLGRARSAITPRSEAQEVWDIFVQAFDHYVELEIIKPVHGVSGALQIWGQATCYKGHATSKPESRILIPSSQLYQYQTT